MGVDDMMVCCRVCTVRSVDDFVVCYRVFVYSEDDMMVCCSVCVQ